MDRDTSSGGHNCPSFAMVVLRQQEKGKVSKGTQAKGKMDAAHEANEYKTLTIQVAMIG